MVELSGANTVDTSQALDGWEAAPLPPQVLKAELENIRRKWPSMPKVTVVDSAADLPGDVTNSKCDGYHRNGYRDVFLVAGNIRSIPQLHKVMAHECIFHHSLEEMLGAYGFSQVQKGLQALKEAGDPTVAVLAADVARKYGPQSARDEAREIVAAAGERFLDGSGEVSIQFGFMKSAYAGIAGWLRDRGVPFAFSNFELQGLIHDATEWVKQPGLEETTLVDKMRPSQSTCVREGTYSGRIVSVTDCYVEQKVGRSDAEIVRHDRGSLSMPVSRGDVVDIRYQAGLGYVTSKGQELER